MTITAYGRERLVLLSADEYRRLKRIDDIFFGRRKRESPADNPFAMLLDRLHAKVEETGLTVNEVDAALNACYAEDRH